MESLMSKFMKFKTFSKPPMFPNAFKKLDISPKFFTFSLLAKLFSPSVGKYSVENF